MRGDPVAARSTAQLLSGPPAATAEEAVRRVLAVQGQDPRGFRLAVRARTLPTVTAADVDAGLTETRSLVVSWLARRLSGTRTSACAGDHTHVRMPCRRADPARRVRRTVPRLTAMWIGWVEFDVLLGDVHSLKGKRAHVRPLVADLRRVFGVSASEVADHDLHRRARIGVSLVAGDGEHVAEMLDAVERFVADRPELELLSAHRGLASSDD